MSTLPCSRGAVSGALDPFVSVSKYGTPPGSLTSDAFAAFLSGHKLLDWVEQLGEVDTDGVEPMTSVAAQTLRRRADVVNDGGDADARRDHDRRRRHQVEVVAHPGDE
mgnify:CR=1 FL=1